MAKYRGAKRKWISRAPTPDELIRHSPPNQKQASKYRQSFSLSVQDVEDLRQDIIMDLMSIPTDKQRETFYVPAASVTPPAIRSAA